MSLWDLVTIKNHQKVAYKQIVWIIYIHTGYTQDYYNYKEALNLATVEMRKPKRSFEHKIANDIKQMIVRVFTVMQGVNRRFDIR